MRFHCTIAHSEMLGRVKVMSKPAAKCQSCITSKDKRNFLPKLSSAVSTQHLIHTLPKHSRDKCRITKEVKMRASLAPPRVGTSANFLSIFCPCVAFSNTSKKIFTIAYCCITDFPHKFRIRLLNRFLIFIS